MAPPVCPLGNARASSRPMVRSTTGLPERGDQPGQSGAANREQRRPWCAAHETDQCEHTRSDGDDRRRAEDGHGPQEHVPGRGQCVDRAVEVAVDLACRVVARVAHGEDRDDRGREHRDRRRGPAGPVGKQRPVGRGISSTVPKIGDGPGGAPLRSAMSQAAARPSSAPVRRTPSAPWWVWRAARGCGSSAPSDRSGPRCPTVSDESGRAGDVRPLVDRHLTSCDQSPAARHDRTGPVLSRGCRSMRIAPSASAISATEGPAGTGSADVGGGRSRCTADDDGCRPLRCATSRHDPDDEGRHDRPDDSGDGRRT